ncbi:hypothetical protein CDAR_248391, partial [Caerostris darwini]
MITQPRDNVPIFLAPCNNWSHDNKEA